VLVGEVSNNFQHTKKVKWINFADFVHQMMVDDGFIFFFLICTRSLKNINYLSNTYFFCVQASKSFANREIKS